MPIQIRFSSRYRDGGRAAWGSLIEGQDRRQVFKVDVGTGRLIELYVPAQREPNPPTSALGGITGSYNILDRAGRFIVPRQREIEVYADSRRGDRFSPLRLVRRYQLPDRAFCRADDKIAGATMTYDGYVAFATEQGVAGTVPRQPSRMTDANLRTLSFNGAWCGNASIPKEQLEEVSNSIAADEDGGIYIVTSKRMRRVNHNARRNRLRSAWSASYHPGTGQSPIRLGLGSGSTPTLMGVGRQDKFVVITDGRDLMHLNLFWRDRIPPYLARSRRGPAAAHGVRLPRPIRRPDRPLLVVRAVGDLPRLRLVPRQQPAGRRLHRVPAGIVRNALAALRGGDPAAAPYGAERIDWNPRRRRCRSRWANPIVSIPNAIPSMSAKSGLAYGVGQRGGKWGVQALSWRTGRSVFFAPAVPHACTPTANAYIDQSPSRAALGSVLTELPLSCENSFYAATEVGPRRAVWTGTFYGLTIYRQRGGRR